MYGKTKNSTVPSDLQAREKLAMYVYEYLLHVGAGKTAQTFLQEIGWDKNITVGESPGFLHQWWCVFWDLYCASPERRDSCDHSTEAKAFHDYSSTSVPPSLNALPPDGMGQPGMPPSYFPPGSVPSPSSHHSNPLMRQPFMSPRYASGTPRPGMQGPGPQLLQSMDHPRQGQMMGMNRMMHQRMPPGSMSPYIPDQFQQPYGAMRMPSSSIPGPGGMPMQMPGRWSNPSGPSGHAIAPSTTPMMRSPQDPMNSEYGHINKPMPHQQMPSSFPMAGNVPENLPSTTMSAAGIGPGLSVSTPNMTPGLNGLNGSGPDPAMMDGLPKNSPSGSIPMNTIGPGGPPPMGPPGGPGGTPHTPQEGAEGENFIPYPENHQDEVESAAILKIKESMQQDAQLFESKENDGNGTGEFSFMS